MRPAVVAYRLLQLNQLRRTSTLTSLDPRSATKAATFFAFLHRGDSFALPLAW